MRAFLLQLLVTASMLLLPLQASAATAAATAASASPAEHADEAPVVVFNREVAVLRAPLFGSPPAARARRTRTGSSSCSTTADPAS